MGRGRLAAPARQGAPGCEWVLESLNAESSQTDGQGRPLLYGKAAAVAVAGNEDGAHKVSADIFQALNDVGVSIAPGTVIHWVGQTQQGPDCQDFDERPEAVHHPHARRRHGPPREAPEGAALPGRMTGPAPAPGQGRTRIERFTHDGPTT
ncbi:hypothetical protein ABZT43_47925 [Streptomyces sp. NPDC005349]|uniref:hypothetical protein n=1 Tax=Streptomyces sp. NPDC005349 TaxID=3157037 RepID=UPI0033BFA680